MQCEKEGLQSAILAVSVAKDAESLASVSLIEELPLKLAYFSELEDGQDLGNIQDNGQADWQRSTSFEYNSEIIEPLFLW